MVNEVAKIHCHGVDPTDEHHLIYFDDIQLQIPLQLRGIVSCFPTSLTYLNICRFEWYEWINYKDKGPKFPQSQRVLGRALGPTVNAGNEMSQWVMRVDGRIFPRQMVRSLSKEEMHSKVEKKKREEYEKLLGIC